jgi:uncharacterized membrane protein YkoI
MQKLLTVLSLAAGLSFGAHASTDCKEDKPGLQKRAKITCEQAKAAALRHAGKGKIVKSELEQAKGKVVYSISIDDGAKDDLVEVKIDAKSGALVEKARDKRDRDEQDGKDDDKEGPEQHDED